jgi:S1-C subfamily serine protease
MFLPNSLRLRPGAPHWKSFPLTIAVATTALAEALIPASVAQEEKPPEVAIATEVPAGLMEAAKKSEAAVFFTMPQSGTKVIPFAGFFITADGLALCPLNPLLDKTVPVFRTSADGATELKKPVVLGVFPDEELALLKFDHKPAATLTLSATPATVGTWLAVVPTAFAKGGKPVTGPIVAHRIATSHSYAKPPRPREKQFSIATGRNPSYDRVFLPGAPVINASGEVVAAFAGSQAMPGQTLRMAHPVDGFQARIDELVKKKERLTLPLAAAKLPLDPALFSDEARLMAGSAVKGDWAEARKFAHAMVEKFPDSSSARAEEFAYAMMLAHTPQGPGPEEIVNLAERTKPPEGASPLDQAAYLERLGQALRVANRPDEAMKALQESDRLDVNAMACITLATLHEKRGELEQAEACWQKATTVDPERIEFWDRYAKVLLARGKNKESDKAQERSFLLEDLYRSR